MSGKAYPKLVSLTVLIVLFMGGLTFANAAQPTAASVLSVTTAATVEPCEDHAATPAATLATTQVAQEPCDNTGTPAAHDNGEVEHNVQGTPAAHGDGEIAHRIQRTSEARETERPDNHAQNQQGQMNNGQANTNSGNGNNNQSNDDHHDDNSGGGQGQQDHHGDGQHHDD